MWGLFGGLASFLVSVEAGAVPDTHGRQQACPARAEPNPANGPISCSWVWERSNGGLDAPIATFAAQVHQESGWKANAVSRVGAQGLAQFMPATASWIGGIVPELAARQPDNPTWALRALTTYDRWLWERIAADTDCERMAMVLSAYNGGLGWLLKDKALAQASGSTRTRWWGAVERYNGGRSQAAFAENRGYPQRIIKVIQPAYAAWGRGVCA